MSVQRLCIAGIFLLALPLSSGELPPEVTAKLLKIVASTSGGKVACREASLKAALEASGVTVDDGAKVVWATNPAQIKMLKPQGKLIVVSSPSMLAAGAGIAITEDGGKPKIFLHNGNIAASGVTLPDALLKVGTSQ